MAIPLKAIKTQIARTLEEFYFDVLKPQNSEQNYSVIKRGKNLTINIQWYNKNTQGRYLGKIVVKTVWCLCKIRKTISIELEKQWKNWQEGPSKFDSSKRTLP